MRQRAGLSYAAAPAGEASVVVDAAERPTERPRRRWLLWWLFGSLLLHLLVLVAFLYSTRDDGSDEPRAASPVTMMFEPAPDGADQPMQPPPGENPDDKTPPQPPVPPQPETAPIPPVASPPSPAPPTPVLPEPPMPPETVPQQTPTPPPPEPLPKAEPTPPSPAEAAPAPEAAPPPAPAPEAELPQAAPAPLPAPVPTPAPQQPPQPKPAPPKPAAPSRPAAPPQPQAQARPAPRPPSDFPAPFNFSWPKPAERGPPLVQRKPPPGWKGFDTSPGLAENYHPAPPHRDAGDQDASIQVSGAQVGSDWIRALHTWWLQHRYYPPQAAENGEDGMVKIHLTIDRTGKVTSVRLILPSGSKYLDMAAVSVFQNAVVPPFPPSTPERAVDVDLTIQYILIRR
jgi:TonB family protein